VFMVKKSCSNCGRTDCKVVKDKYLIKCSMWQPRKNPEGDLHMKGKEIEFIVIPRDVRLDSYRGRLEIAGQILNEIYKETKTNLKGKPYTATCRLDLVIEHLKEAQKIYEMKYPEKVIV